MKTMKTNSQKWQNIVIDIKPENKDNQLCPARSFRMYIEYLEPSNEYMWQLALYGPSADNPQTMFSEQHISEIHKPNL